VTRRQFAAALSAPLLAEAIPGSTLVHEHIIVDFIGADRIEPGRYDPEEVYRAAKPKLEAVYRLGCRRFLDCVPNFLGRDPLLFRRLADSTGIDIWTNTGLYAAGNYKFLPSFARSESAVQLAGRWIAEFERGVEGVRPRFIKIGVNKGPLGELDRKVVEAAALCSKETGLTIAAHTGDGAAALEELEIIAASVPASRFVWVHAQNEIDHEIHAKVAAAGAWVEFDGIHAKSANWHRQCVEAMAKRDHLGQVLISQDSGWYRVGEPGGGQYNGYEYIYTDFLPLLPPGWRSRLMITNPARAFPA
jgi:phosphotriesterase-related protein